jgi:hypothetical protein
LPLHDDGVALGESRDPCLSHDLAADVVAVRDVDRELDVHEGATLHLEEDEEQIPQLAAAAVSARHHDGRGDDLVLEQPAGDVDVVYRRVVAMGGVEEQRRRLAERSGFIQYRKTLPSAVGVNAQFDPSI